MRCKFEKDSMKGSIFPSILITNCIESVSNKISNFILCVFMRLLLACIHVHVCTCAHVCMCTHVCTCVCVQGERGGGKELVGDKGEGERI